MGCNDTLPFPLSLAYYTYAIRKDLSLYLWDFFQSKMKGYQHFLIKRAKQGVLYN